MTRLDVIRKSVLGCDCAQCEMIRELLAVVEATLGTRTIHEMMEDIRESILSGEQRHGSEELVAWELLI